MRRTAGRLGQVLALIGAATLLAVSATEVFASPDARLADCQGCISNQQCGDCCRAMGLGHTGGTCNTLNGACFCF